MLLRTWHSKLAHLLQGRQYTLGWYTIACILEQMDLHSYPWQHTNILHFVCLLFVFVSSIFNIHQRLDLVFAKVDVLNLDIFLYAPTSSLIWNTYVISARWLENQISAHSHLPNNLWLFIFKVKILMLIKWAYKSSPHTNYVDY